MSLDPTDDLRNEHVRCKVGWYDDRGHVQPWTVSPRQTEIAKVDQPLRFGNLVRVYI